MSQKGTVLVQFARADELWTSEVEPGSTLLEAARLCGAPVHTLCNGIGACVQCKIRIEEPSENLTPPNALERDRLGNIFHLTGERLACQCTVLGPVRVEPLEPRLPKRKPVQTRRSKRSN